ncbi:alpha/beta hydrolase [Boseaceae bacterium BT-24-1]|nr:alpha/beta hydrolase [Boseaceae bacterium BT-24-1]
MKPTLILVSGMLCDETVWLPTTVLLQDDAEIEIINLGAATSVGNVAEAVLSKAPQSFALAGHSLGGRVALEVVRRAPERVGLLGLFGTAYRGRPPGEAGLAEVSARESMVAGAKIDGLEALSRQWASRMLHAGRQAEAEVVEPIVAMVTRQGLEKLEAQVRMGLSRPDAEDLLPRIASRTLVLAGREDQAMPLGPHEEMARAIPDAELVVIERCGHLLTYERPETCAAAIRPWLASFGQR